jgi:ethanolamine utilization microcompartment shell protein EutL
MLSATFDVQTARSLTVVIAHPLRLLVAVTAARSRYANVSVYRAPEFVGQLGGDKAVSTGTLALSAAANATACAADAWEESTKVPAGTDSVVPA